MAARDKAPNDVTDVLTYLLRSNISGHSRDGCSNYHLVDLAVQTSFHLAVFPVKAGFANLLLSLLSFSEMYTFLLLILLIYIDYLLIPGSYPFFVFLIESEQLTALLFSQEKPWAHYPIF